MTELKLLNVPLENDYKHTLYFETRSAQQDYFTSRAVKTYTDFSYQRKDEYIRIPDVFDNVLNCNYVMYRNPNYSNKWFYAFIIDIKYISDGVTDVYIKTDVMQTWLLGEDYNVKSCFVEREHTDNDTVGINTVPESLETGEYICNNVIHNESTSSCVYIIASTVRLGTGAGSDAGLRLYNNVINGWLYYWFDTIDEVDEVLDDLAELRTNDAIVSIFVMPKHYITKDNDHSVYEDSVPNYHYWYSPDLEGAIPQERILKPTRVNGYLPHNNKLLTYPYSYLLIDNNAGATAVYKYELFNSYNPNNCEFIIYSAITPGGSMRLIPLNYNGVEGENNHFGLPSGKFPICGWQSDYYTNWLTQNSLNLEVQAESIRLSGLQSLTNATAGGISDAIKGDLGGAVGAMQNQYLSVANYENQIKGITAQKEIHAFQSPTVGGNINCGDVNFVMGNIRFSAYQMSVKEEYAKIIDNYFSMFGYQVNRVKVPNKNHRSRYWYTKTVGCDISGSVPLSDMQIIKSCYDNGITFWKNPNEVGNYTDSENELIANLII